MNLTHLLFGGNMVLSKENWKVCKQNYIDVTEGGNWIHEENTHIDWRYHKEDDYLIIHFQCTSGTDNGYDWKQNFKWFPKVMKPYKKVAVHGGIFEQYLGVRNKILDMVYEDKNIKHIRVGGFSQGAGFTYFCVQDLLYHFPDLDILGIGYESPRVFIRNKYIKNMLKNNLIIVKTFWDATVHVPPVCWGFAHYGKSVWIGKWWKILPIQHRPEQIIKNLEDYEKKLAKKNK